MLSLQLASTLSPNLCSMLSLQLASTLSPNICSMLSLQLASTLSLLTLRQNNTEWQTMLNLKIRKKTALKEIYSVIYSGTAHLFRLKVCYPHTHTNIYGTGTYLLVYTMSFSCQVKRR